MSKPGQVMDELLRSIQSAQRDAGERVVHEHLVSRGPILDSSPPLVSLERHNQLTMGPCEWTSTRVQLHPFGAACAAFGTKSLADEQRLYRALQAYEWKKSR